MLFPAHYARIQCPGQPLLEQLWNNASGDQQWLQNLMPLVHAAVMTVRCRPDPDIEEDP